MKYCKNCGMLLEDTQEICIGCGMDVSDPENTSLFPPEVAEKMEEQKAQEKKKNSIVIAIIIVFILLAVLIGVIAVVASRSAVSIPIRDEIEEEEAIEEAQAEEEETLEAEALDLPEEEPEERQVRENRKVSDDLGTYYIEGEVFDDAGKLMFTTLYPEDFGGAEPVASFNYARYSDQFPIVMSCIVSDADNTMKLTYMSPEHYWYQVSSTTGKKRDKEVDLDNYMSYLSYDGPQNYLEALIKQAYSGAKLELVETHEASDAVTKSLSDLLSDKTKTLTGDIGDYARIGTSTTYSPGESGSSAAYYNYKINVKGGTIYADYYVSMIYNTFSYTNEQLGDKGTVTEWLPLCVISYECGNEERFHFYEEAFTVFVNNSRLTKDFFRVNEAYGKTIDDALEAHKDPTPLTIDSLKAMEASFDESVSLKKINSEIFDFLSTPDSDLKTFSSGDTKVTGAKDSVQAFYSSEKKMVFITPSDKEYPGDEYIDLFAP